MYQAEYGRLKEDLPLPNTSAIWKLDPYYEKIDHLLRVGGRLQHSDLPEGTKHPIILPHGHAVVEKIIQVYTRSCFMLDQRVLFQCYDKRSGSRRDTVKLKESWESASFVDVNELVHVRKKKKAPLPSERGSLTPVGIDFAGPLFVPESAFSAKAYICIFPHDPPRAYR